MSQSFWCTSHDWLQVMRPDDPLFSDTYVCKNCGLRQMVTMDFKIVAPPDTKETK